MRHFEKFSSPRRLLAKVAKNTNSRLSLQTDLQLAQQIRAGVPLDEMQVRHRVAQLRREKLKPADLVRISEGLTIPAGGAFYSPPVAMSSDAWLAGDEPPLPDELALDRAANDDDDAQEQIWEDAQPTSFVKIGVSPDEIVDYYQNRELDRYHEHRDRATLQFADNSWLNEQRQQLEAKTAHAILKGFVAGFEHPDIQFIVPRSFQRFVATLDEQGCDDLVGLLADRRRGQPDTVRKVLPLLIAHGPPEIVLAPAFLRDRLQRLVNARTGRCDTTSLATLAVLPALASLALARTATTRDAIAAPVTPGDFIGYLKQLTPSRDNKIRFVARQALDDLATQFGEDFSAANGLVFVPQPWAWRTAPKLPAGHRPPDRVQLG